jgi:hypothetical protein
MLQESHNWIRFLLRKNRAGFISSDDITKAINASSRDLWKELIKKFHESGVISDLLVPFKGSVTDTLASGSATLSGLAEAHLSGVSVKITGEASEYPTFLLHSDKDWVQRRFLERPDSNFLLKRYTLTSSGSVNFTLTSDFKSHKDVIYYNDTSASKIYEGQVLDHDEYYNRVNSSILSPNIENPIATIHDDTVIVSPQLGTGDEYIFPYDAYSSIKNAFSRYQKSGSDMVVTVDGGVTEDIISYYYTFPVTASHDAVTYTSGIPANLATVTETGWDKDAFGEIVTRAMSYLGVPIQDKSAIQLEQIKNINEIQSPN